MSTITYGVSEEKYSLGDNIRISYGIVAYADSKTDGIASIVASVRDISNNKTRIEQLADFDPFLIFSDTRAAMCVHNDHQYEARLFPYA